MCKNIVFEDLVCSFISYERQYFSNILNILSFKVKKKLKGIKENIRIIVTLAPASTTSATTTPVTTTTTVATTHATRTLATTTLRATRTTETTIKMQP